MNTQTEIGILVVSYNHRKGRVARSWNRRNRRTPNRDGYTAISRVGSILGIGIANVVRYSNRYRRLIAPCGKRTDDGVAYRSGASKRYSSASNRVVSNVIPLNKGNNTRTTAATATR